MPEVKGAVPVSPVPVPCPPATPPEPLQPFNQPNYTHPVSIEEFREHAKNLVDEICEYWGGMERFPVRPHVQPGYLARLLPEQAPEEPEPFPRMLDDFKAHVLPGITHWQSPNFFAYFPANASLPSMLAEMICNGLAAVGFTWVGSPAGTELESIVLDWLARLLHLPECFLSRDNSTDPLRQGGGVIQASASEGVLVAMLAARTRALQGRPPEDVAKLVAYSSDQAHSCFLKACMIAGISQRRCIPGGGATGFALDTAELAARVAEDRAAGLTPFFVMGSVGTTSSCAVDNLAAIGALANAEGMWFHVDAAYAGVTGMLPECRHYFRGLELADSYGVNPHKWLLVNFDCSAFYVRDARPLRAALALTPAYMRAPDGNTRDYKDWEIPLGRRFRALKLWFVLRSYGAEGLRAYLRHHMALARTLAARVAADPRFALAAEPRWGLVCFTVQGLDGDATRALVETLNASGRLFLTGTELEGRYIIRVAIGTPSTQAEHVDAAWEQISAATDEALQLAAEPTA